MEETKIETYDEKFHHTYFKKHIHVNISLCVFAFFKQ